MFMGAPPVEVIFPPLMAVVEVMEVAAVVVRTGNATPVQAGTPEGYWLLQKAFGSKL